MLDSSPALPDDRPPHVARYFARVDNQVLGMSPADHAAFLRREFDRWEARYLRFQQQVAAGENLEGDVTAFDYALTIGEVGARLSRIENERISA